MTEDKKRQQEAEVLVSLARAKRDLRSLRVRAERIAGLFQHVSRSLMERPAALVDLGKPKEPNVIAPEVPWTTEDVADVLRLEAVVDLAERIAEAEDTVRRLEAQRQNLDLE